MRRITAYLATILVFSLVSSTIAQCTRSGAGGGGTAAGGFAPRGTTFRGTNTPLAALNPINSSPSAAFLAAQYRSQLAQQQFLIAQQQRYLQALALSQQQPRNPASPGSAEDFGAEQQTLPVDKATPALDRREQLRQRNAERAYEIAERAASRGNRFVAQQNYRKVIRLLGQQDGLGRLAAESLEKLDPHTSDVPNDKTLLAKDSR